MWYLIKPLLLSHRTIQFAPSYFRSRLTLLAFSKYFPDSFEQETSFESLLTFYFEALSVLYFCSFSSVRTRHRLMVSFMVPNLEFGCRWIDKLLLLRVLCNIVRYVLKSFYAIEQWWGDHFSLLSKDFTNRYPNIDWPCNFGLSHLLKYFSEVLSLFTNKYLLASILW